MTPARAHVDNPVGPPMLETEEPALRRDLTTSPDRTSLQSELPDS
jgi:hypothetical protein